MRHNSRFSIEVFLETELRDRYGTVKFRQRKPIRSFLLNWSKALYGMTYSVANSGVITLADTGGTGRKFPKLNATSTPFFRFRNASGDTSYGILVGNGTAEVSLDDCALASLIPHGTEIGQLYYYETLTTYFTDSDRTFFHVYRDITNRSEDSVTVSEIGLAFRHDTPDGAFRFLILRDLLDPAVTLAPGDTYTGRYIFTFIL